MNNQRMVVFDLETVPDLKAGRALLGLAPDTPDPEVRRILGQRYAKDGQDTTDVFVKIPLHRIVCIGAIYAKRADRSLPWEVTGFGVGHVGVRSERELVSGFIDSLAIAPAPQIVGFNSSSFDLLVLRYRAFALSVPAHSIHKGNGRDYWYRFGKDHIDLCDVISGFGASPRPSLAELAALCGVPVKITGIDGSQVEPMVSAGRVAEVATYCESDILTTYLLCLRFGLVTGDMTSDSYKLSLRQLVRFLTERVPKRPHLAHYVNALSSALDGSERNPNGDGPAPYLGPSGADLGEEHSINRT